MKKKDPVSIPGLGFIMAAVFSILSSPLSSAKAGKTPEYVDLTLSVRSPVLTTFPYGKDAAEAKPVLDLLFESLLRRDEEDFSYQPLLAERWELGQDGLSFTFWLNKKARFSDGSPVTGEDVVFSYDIIDSPLPAMEPWRAHLAKTKSAGVNKDGSVTFLLHKPQHTIFDIVARLKILKKSHYEKFLKTDPEFVSADLNKFAVGSGRWQIESWSSDRLALTVRPDYWNLSQAPTRSLSKTGEKNITRRIFLVNSSPESEWQTFVNGKIDVVGLSLEKLAELERSEQKHDFDIVKAVNKLPPDYQFIGWNNGNEIFRDYRIRQAMAYLIELEGWDGEIGKYTTAAIGPYSPRTPEHVPNLVPYKYNPVLAAELLKSTGWLTNAQGIYSNRGKQLAFTLIYPVESAGLVSEKLNRLAAKLKKVGILMTPRAMIWQDLLNKLYLKDFEAVFMVGSRVPDENIFRLFHSTSQARENFVDFKNSKVDALLEQHDIASSREERINLARQIQQLIYIEQPYTFLTEPKFTVYAVRRDIARRVDSFPYDIGLQHWARK